jgi:hypothetical protein
MEQIRWLKTEFLSNPRLNPAEPCFCYPVKCPSNPSPSTPNSPSFAVSAAPQASVRKFSD